eukprot:scaffold50_cov420-Prasinococcus_capsulatus_cf.AAC.9
MELCRASPRADLPGQILLFPSRAREVAGFRFLRYLARQRQCELRQVVVETVQGCCYHRGCARPYLPSVTPLAH